MTDKSRKGKELKKKGLEEEVVYHTESVKDELTEAMALADQYLDAAKRIQADFDNYRKRSVKEMNDLKRKATDDLITELLSTVDDLDRALENTDEDTEFIRGIKGVRQNLMKALASYGLEEIPTNCKFNPEYHEALSVAEGKEDGEIAEVYQKGYVCGDRVLRYSKVKVNKALEKEGRTAGETAEQNREE